MCVWGFKRSAVGINRGEFEFSGGHVCVFVCGLVGIADPKLVGMKVGARALRASVSCTGAFGVGFVLSLVLVMGV